MQRDRKLSSDNELDIKYIITFTVAFVVISSIILVAGYTLLSVSGILGQGQAELTGGPTPVPGPATPTPRPTYVAIGVPTEIPCPTPVPTLQPPTPTPSPTPVPSPYTVRIVLGQANVGSMKYTVTFSLVPGSQPLDMTQIKLKIWDWEKTYCDYSYDEAMYWLDGVWSDDNGDKRLDPIGESLAFELSDYSLNIPLDRETKLALFVGNTQICYIPLPAMQNQADLPGESPDPGSGGIVQNPDNVVRWY